MTFYPPTPPRPGPAPQSPPTLGYATPQPAMGAGWFRPEYIAIAKRQRAMMWCLLANVSLAASRYLVPPPARPLVGLAVLAASVTAAVFVVLLAIPLYSTGSAVVLGLLTVVPFLGLLVLLAVNQRATKTLRAHGIRVG
ncbi:MAG TPA: hypothetical protein VF796_10515, partial [Humisphaera sp.]